MGVKPATWNLHAQDPKRAVTWYDEGADIVWLCAVTNHDYKEVVRRSKSGMLWPTAADRADVELFKADRQRIPLEVAGLRDALVLRESAEAKPGTCQRATLAGEVDVSVVVLPLTAGSLSPADYCDDEELTFPLTAPPELGPLRQGADHVLWWQRP